MKQIIGFISILFWVSVCAQDTTVYFAGWGKADTATFVSRKALKAVDYSQVKLTGDRPVLIRHYSADQVLQEHFENTYDKYGNHVSSRRFDATGQLRAETKFKNDPQELALFRVVFGPTFSPENSNFMIHREYNDYGRETLYEIIGVDGRNICSRVTTYREDRRKAREFLTDDLRHQVLTDRRYKYIDAENRTVLEEFDGAGKLTQRVVLFDHNDIIQE